MKRKITIFGFAFAAVLLVYAAVAWNLLRGAGAYRMSTWLGNVMSVSWQPSALVGLVLLLALGIPVCVRLAKRKQVNAEVSAEQPASNKEKKRGLKKSNRNAQAETPMPPTEKIAPAAATMPLETEEKIAPVAATMPLETEEKIAPVAATMPLETEEKIAPATATMPLEMEENEPKGFRCPRCNAELKKVVRFCAECGADLKGGSV